MKGKSTELEVEEWKSEPDDNLWDLKRWQQLAQGCLRLICKG